MRSHFLRAAHRGIEFIGSASDVAEGANFSIDYSSIPIQPNDVAVLTLLHRDFPTQTPSLSGFTSAETEVRFANTTSVYYRTLDGTETTVASAETLDIDAEAVALLSVFRGVTATGWALSEAYRANDGNSPDPNSSASVTRNKALVLAIGTISNRIWENPGPPSGYTDAGSVNFANVNYGQVEHAYVIATGVVDPPAFAGNVLSNDLNGYTIGYTLTLQEIY